MDQEEYKINLREEAGRQLKEARKKAGLTLRDLAEKTGIAYNYISRVELGRHNVTLDTISAISNALGATVKLSINK